MASSSLENADVKWNEVPSTTTTPSGHQMMAMAASGRLEILEVKEEHGFFRKAVPLMPLILASICLLFNTFLPGSGTLISAFAGLWCKETEYGRGKAFAVNIAACLIQLLTAPLVVGWIWSIMWGIIFVNISRSVEVRRRLSQRRMEQRQSLKQGQQPGEIVGDEHKLEQSTSKNNEVEKKALTLTMSNMIKARVLRNPQKRRQLQIPTVVVDESDAQPEEEDKGDEEPRQLNLTSI